MKPRPPMFPVFRSLRGFRPICLVLALLWMNGAEAQVPAFRRIDGKDGIPQSQITTFLEDRQGFLWIGTLSGVARMGAGGCKVFDLASGLGAGRVTAFLEDDEGGLWVAQAGAALSRIHGSKVESFDGSRGLPEMECFTLALTPERQILVGTAHGLYRNVDGRFQRLPLGEEWNQKPIRSMVYDRLGHLWIGRRDGRIALWDGTRLQDQTPPFTEASPRINRIVLDPTGGVWVLTQKSLWGRSLEGSWKLWTKKGFPDGVRLEDLSISASGDKLLSLGGKGLWIQPLQGPGIWYTSRDGLPEERVSTAFLDHRGILWVGTSGEYIYVLASRGLRSLTKMGDLLIGGAYCMEESAEGVYIGTSRGLFLWKEGKGVIRRWTTGDGLPGNELWGICLDGVGGLWIGSDRGLAKLQRDGKIQRYPHLKDGRTLQILRDGASFLLATDRGIIRIDSQGREINRVDFAKYDLPGDVVVLARAKEPVPKPPRAALGAPGGAPQGRRDEHSGSTRFEPDTAGGRPPPQPGGTAPGGRSAASAPLTHEPHGPAGPSLRSIPPDAVAAHGGFGTGSKERVLVGSGRGLWELQGNLLRRIHPDAAFAGAEVVSVYERMEGELWVGTSQGLFIQRQGNWVLLTAPADLPNSYVYFLGDGGDGLVAVGHGKGVTLMDGTGRAFHLNQNLGLVDNESNQGAVFTDSKGHLWMGMATGLNILEIGQTLPLPDLLPPSILEVRYAEGSSPGSGKVTLPPRPEFVEFEFDEGLPITVNPLVYEVNLEGQSKSWQRLGGLRQMRYTHLPGGSYTFRLRASLDGQRWVEAPPVSLAIKPTWLEHPLGQALATLGVVLAILGLVRWRTRRLMVQAKALEAKVEDRTRSLDQRNHELEEAHDKVQEVLESKIAFSRMVVHDLRSPLTTMTLLADRMNQEALDRGEEPPGEIDMLQREARRLEELLQRLLDQARGEATSQTMSLAPANPHAILEGLDEVLQLKSANAGLTFEFREDPAAAHVQIMSDPLAIQQVVLNLVGNALKYTPAPGHLALRSNIAKDTWVLEISDTGRGLKSSQVENLFKPFTQVEMSDITQGWGLGLSIVKNLVDAHHGLIEVDSAPGQGTTFRVVIPLIA